MGVWASSGGGIRLSIYQGEMSVLLSSGGKTNSKNWSRDLTKQYLAAQKISQ